MATVAPRRTGVGSVASAIGEGFRIGQGFQRLELARQREARQLATAQVQAGQLTDSESLLRQGQTGLGGQPTSTQLTRPLQPGQAQPLSQRQQGLLAGVEKRNDRIAQDFIEHEAVQKAQKFKGYNDLSDVEQANLTESIRSNPQFQKNILGRLKGGAGRAATRSASFKKFLDTQKGGAKQFLQEESNIKATVTLQDAIDNQAPNANVDISKLDGPQATDVLYKDFFAKRDAIINDKNLGTNKKNKAIAESGLQTRNALEGVDRKFGGQGAGRFKIKDYFVSGGGGGRGKQEKFNVKFVDKSGREREESIKAGSAAEARAKIGKNFKVREVTQTAFASGQRQVSAKEKTQITLNNLKVAVTETERRQGIQDLIDLQSSAFKFKTTEITDINRALSNLGYNERVIRDKNNGIAVINRGGGGTSSSSGVADVKAVGNKFGLGD